VRGTELVDFVGGGEVFVGDGAVGDAGVDEGMRIDRCPNMADTASRLMPLLIDCVANV